MKSAAPIYVESRINCSIDELWAHTQTPALHQRWDVRFSTIDYLERATTAEPQRFRYATTVAPGFSVAGCGETLGERHRSDGTAYSGLRFWSDHPLSLIASGSGYWRYVPQADGTVRFLTRYDYTVRWGAFGQLIDRIAFRPLFGWGTAWSFDRLRLWIEQDLTPEQALRKSLTRLASTVAAVLVAVLALWLLVGVAFTLSDSAIALQLGAGLVAWVTYRLRSSTPPELPSGRRPLRVRPPSSSTKPTLQGQQS